MSLQSRQMRVLEAKDFLVKQTAEQAALENVPLSDLEKRMMYFTAETDECPEDPIALNDAFEAEYDTNEYEAKISKLLRHAHKRIRKGNPEAGRKWKEAIQELSKGDHYILFLRGEGLGLASGKPAQRPPYDSLKLLGTAILVVAGMLLFTYVWHRFGPHFFTSSRLDHISLGFLLNRRCVFYRSILLEKDTRTKTFKLDPPASLRKTLCDAVELPLLTEFLLGLSISQISPSVSNHLRFSLNREALSGGGK